jgi:hypothetical protein
MISIHCVTERRKAFYIVQFLHVGMNFGLARVAFVEYATLADLSRIRGLEPPAIHRRSDRPVEMRLRIP